MPHPGRDPVIIGRLMHRIAFPWFLVLAVALGACGDNLGVGPDAAPPDAGPPPPPPDARTRVEVPLVYVFESRFVPGISAVLYEEPTLLHVLAVELDLAIAALTQAIDDGALTPSDGQVAAALDRYYDFDLAATGRAPLALETDPPARQPALDAVALGRDVSLRDRIAGVDTAGQHRDFGQDFAGWQEGGAASPDQLVRYWLGRIDELAVQRAAGAAPVDPDGQEIPTVYLTPAGQDLRQLVRSFLLGAVFFFQAVDVHLDDDTADLGIAASNARLGEVPYSAAEHHWDQAFGYFGAAFDYASYMDEEIARQGGRPERAGGYADTNANGEIDLRYEYNYGSAVLAGARDVAAGTDATATLFTALLTGRALLQGSGDALTEARRQELVAQRDIIARAWEEVLVAAALAAADGTLAAMDAFGTEAYDFAAHARHWSTLKGLALGLQFSRLSPLAPGDFALLHQGIGDAPVLASAGAEAIAAYRAALEQARDLLAATYGLAGD